MNELPGPFLSPPPKREDCSASTEPDSLIDRVRSLRLPAELPLSQARLAWLPWMLCVFLACLCGFLAWRILQTRPPNEQPQDALAEPEPSATAPATGKPALEAGGYIVPVHRVQVSPKVGGEVVELFIEEGQSVRKGQKLARLDPAKYAFEVRRLEALVGQAQDEYSKLQHGSREEEKKQAAAALREAEEQRDLLHDQARRLRRAGPTAASPEELFAIERQLSAAEHKVEQLKQASKIIHDGPRPEDIEKARHNYLDALAQRDNARYDLENTEVLAPISGTILAKHAEVGNTVRPEAFSNGLSPSLCDMADLQQIDVDVDVSERDLKVIALRQRCEIRTEAQPDRVYSGYVSRLMPEANRSKASVSVRVRIYPVPANDPILRPEMRARVAFLSNVVWSMDEAQWQEVRKTVALFSCAQGGVPLPLW